ncbi:MULTISPECIES: methionine synthase [unclassified Fusibacter]|uniref:methionine synthase n=1 Tax=unclassified Fusibacter TaxID=2624464 RepID=UPI0010119632|nr:MULTISPECIES: methionine synthase [unclassified Fusibacter]MCK8060565.1 methionine synthase [Fusibacter sp. A2]NPE22981.1 methionine synthase [Fusibacter sp. A1]RXV60046.1 methionine synthase [Fusibacter sp. A1]
MKRFLELFKEKIVVLDGAMGTMIQQYNLQEEDYRKVAYEDHEVPLKGNHDVLVKTRPDVIEAIHRAYYKAGADIVETNTFNANRISQADYHLEHDVYEINVQAVRVARKAAESIDTDRPLFVAGAIGPTNKTLSISPKVEDPGFRSIDFDEMVSAYEEQALALIDGGVDAFLIETVFDSLNARAALVAIENALSAKKLDLPVLLSGTLTDKSGRSLTGQTMEAFFKSLDHPRVVALGLNCSFGAKELVPYIKELARTTEKYISVYPNAGLPNQFGAYDELPETTVEFLKELVGEQALNMVGGCCGTTPSHIEAIADLVRDERPRVPEKLDEPLILAGLETVVVDPSRNYVNVGERTNVAGSKKFARLIREKKYTEALDVAREQVENGAQVIDINFDDAMLDAKEEMVHFLRLITSEPEIAKVPVMIDSSKWEVLEAGLKAIQGRSIVNSISLKNGEAEFIAQASIIRQFNAAVVVMAFDEKGQADSYKRKIEVCARAYEILTEKVGFDPKAIIFDPNILAIATGIEEHDNYAVDYIEATRWIKENLYGAKVSGGVSNLSFSFRGLNHVREAMHAVFLYHAVNAGMDMGIVNPGMLEPYDEIEKNLIEMVEDVVLNRSKGAFEKLLEWAQNHKEDAKSGDESARLGWREETVEERLKHSLIKGVTQYLDEDLHELLAAVDSPLDIIEGPLMSGMRVVGERFGEGKMFLPQVVKTARVMKQAVSILQPYIEESQQSEGARKAGKVLLATVKGDVHDIGKNIVGVILACNNFEVIDLGIMVSAEAIVEAALEHKVDIIGLSGLITPSLDEMRHIISEVRRHNMDLPIIIGGATTSKVHTAVRLEPEYPKYVYHATDASKTVAYAKELISDRRDLFAQELHLQYETLRQTYSEIKRPLASYEKTLEDAFLMDYEGFIPPVPKVSEVSAVSYSIKELRETIDWTFFFTSWGMRKKYPDILTDDHYGHEAMKLFTDANNMLDEFENDERLVTRGVFSIAPCSSSEGKLIIKDASGEQITQFNIFRQQEVGSEHKSLTDYIAPESSGIVDYVGMFAVTAGYGFDEVYRECKSVGDEYRAIMTKMLADRIAESFAERLHLDIRKKHWGFAVDEALSAEDLFRGKYRSIRPAIGYPSLPDHSEKEQLFELLDVKRHTGMTLTSSYMMQPVASVCGLIFAHPQANYFNISKLGQDQVQAYAHRKEVSLEMMKRLLGGFF